MFHFPKSLVHTVLNKSGRSLIHPVQNKKGQSLIEYLILVALVAVGSMAVVRVVAGNVSVKYAQIAEALGSKKNSSAEVKDITDNMVSKKDLTDFLQGAKDRENKQ
ncbi:MAG: hypothetical protein V4736_03235 [Bdellovibrionota bacterium]